MRRGGKDNQASIWGSSYSFWGIADHAFRDAQHVLTLWKATYTTCPPTSHLWSVWASKLKLNKTIGKGYVSNFVLKVKKVPVFYFPYYFFPIDNRRTTGFLTPSFFLTKHSGFHAKVPFYWSMAPNYDMIFTTQYDTDRGAQFEDYFRYISEQDTGALYVSLIPHDKKFHNFRDDLINQYGNSTGDKGLYVDQLRGMHDMRGYISFRNHYTSINPYANGAKGTIPSISMPSNTAALPTSISPLGSTTTTTSEVNHSWDSDINIQYVSDPYYFSDYSHTYELSFSNLLLNKVNVRYKGDHWKYYGLLQAYEPLRTINQLNLNVKSQYMRLPELDAGASYPNFWKGNDFNIALQYVDFLYSSSFTPKTFEVPVGQRFHALSSISHPFYWSAGYITPTLYLDNVAYLARLAKPNEDSPRPSFNQARTIPLFNLKTGIYFDRHFSLFHHKYIQTLEPQLYYLFVPYMNQDKYPNFDTQILNFSQNDLGSINRFSGFDRINNANQMTLKVTSDILNDYNAKPIITSAFGMMYYFDHPKVCLNSSTTGDSCEIDKGNKTSPLTGSLSWNINSYMSASTSANYSFQEHRLQNVQAGITGGYRSGQDRIITLGYSWFPAKQGETVDSYGLSTATDLIHVGSVWKLNDHWTMFGYYYANLALKRPNTYYAGFEYNSCCWAIRFIGQHTFYGLSASSSKGNIHNEYTNVYYVQLLFKGLTRFHEETGTKGRGHIGRIGNLLTSTIPGYADPFSD